MKSLRAVNAISDFTYLGDGIGSKRRGTREACQASEDRNEALRLRRRLAELCGPGSPQAIHQLDTRRKGWTCRSTHSLSVVSLFPLARELT